MRSLVTEDMLTMPPPPDARAGEAPQPQPQIQALEAMVAELLRPMLRR